MGCRKLRVAIIGCGTAGPAAAVLLKRQGHEVGLFERAPALAPVGAGFLLQPSGMAVLEELGIKERVLAHAARVERLHVMEVGGTTLLKLNYREIGRGHFGAGLHRPVLLHYLAEAMREAEVNVHLGCEIVKVCKRDSSWSIEAADGSKWQDFDLLIIADGARSTLRNLVGTPGVNRGYTWGAHWFIGKNGGTFPEDELYQVVDGTRRLGGFLATGRDLDGGEPLVSLFWSIKLADDYRWRSRPLDEWKQEILSLFFRCTQALPPARWWMTLTMAGLVARRGRRGE